MVAKFPSRNTPREQAVGNDSNQNIPLDIISDMSSFESITMYCNHSVLSVLEVLSISSSCCSDSMSGISKFGCDGMDANGTL